MKSLEGEAKLTLLTKHPNIMNIKCFESFTDAETETDMFVL